MKILIVGGGMGGTALASFLKDRADVTLIDKAPKWGNIGYAIALWGNGRKILRELGVEHELLKDGYKIPWNVLADKDGDVLTRFSFNAFKPYGETLVVTRTALHTALIKSMGKDVTTRLGLTIDKLRAHKQGADVTFSDGSKDSFDLVVGADGVHSQVRDMVFGKDYLSYYGWSVWVFWTPKGFPQPRGVFEHAAGGKLCFTYPMKDSGVVMLATAESSNAKENKKVQLSELFKNFEDSIANMVDSIEDPEHIFHDRLVHIDMPDWYKDRVVLLGDAQHASSPITGMGASMALEDAFVLQDELKKVQSTDEISEALASYAKRRGRRVRSFRKASHTIERWLMVRSPWLTPFRNLFVRLIPPSFFTKRIEKLLKEKL
jgi:2-polyprenyl-6-methoxyphenol hydroxylase-like FAD-dependent oxidoreductase